MKREGLLEGILSLLLAVGIYVENDYEISDENFSYDMQVKTKSFWGHFVSIVHISTNIVLINLKSRTCGCG